MVKESSQTSSLTGCAPRQRATATSGWEWGPSASLLQGCCWLHLGRRDLALRVLVTHLGRLRLSLACRDVTCAAFPVVTCQSALCELSPLPDTTRERRGTGAWRARRGETSPIPYLAQPCPCTKAAETQRGAAPKEQNPLLKGDREPATSLLLL